MKSHFDISNTYIVKDNFREFNIHRCLKYIEKQGKKTYGQSFSIYEEDRLSILKLLVYAINDQNNADKLEIDLNKGILLSGPVGCGKTSLMHLIKPFFNTKYSYKIKSTREIAFEFSKNGFDSFNPYIQNLVNLKRLNGYCFDDLGSEPKIKHFGVECNVMREILLSRYEANIESKAITHITTNLSATEIESLYGCDLRSRMREMFNVIGFSSNSLDKRV